MAAVLVISVPLRQKFCSFMLVLTSLSAVLSNSEIRLDQFGKKWCVSKAQRARQSIPPVGIFSVPRQTNKRLLDSGFWHAVSECPAGADSDYYRRPDHFRTSPSALTLTWIPQSGMRSRSHGAERAHVIVYAGMRQVA